MSNQNSASNKVSFLDITEFILKQRSPLIRPTPSPLQKSVHDAQLSPEIFPALDSEFQYSITPLFETRRKPSFDIFRSGQIYDFQCFTLEPKFDEPSTKRQKRAQRTYYDLPLWENFEFQEIFQQRYDSSEEQSDFESSNEEPKVSQGIFQSESEEKDLFSNYEEKQSTTGSFLKTQMYDKWQGKNLKIDLIKMVQSIVQDERNPSDQMKLELIQQKLAQYLLQNEKYDFEQELYQGRKPIKQIVNEIIKKLERIFSKNIGGLPFEKRRLKILKYLEKKKYRVWKKKVNYNCRKQVADSRFRIKGKFVTQEQAREQLGLELIEGFTPDQLKQFLQKGIKA